MSWHLTVSSGAAALTGRPRPLPLAWKGAGLVAALTVSLLCGCASPPAPISDRVVLLPQADGSASAGELLAGSQRLLLDRAYAGAVLQGGEIGRAHV